MSHEEEYRTLCQIKKHFITQLNVDKPIMLDKQTIFMHALHITLQKS